MKKTIFLSVAILAIAVANAKSEVITLDLTKSVTPLEFNSSNGSWTGTYDDDVESIDSQVFSFYHGSMSDWNTWWGFTASNHCDNTRPENTLVQQWSNMARGGIELADDGTVKTDQFGAPVSSSQVPYLVAFYGSFMSARPVDVEFTDGKCYEPVGVYVNLNSYSYYSMEYGDSFARAFTNGDRFTLTVHGVAPDNTEKSVDVTLAEYSNGDLTINRGWKYVDLSALGVVNELYFTLDSTDSGDYGMNTPAYFCIDKLMVKPSGESSVAKIVSDKTEIRYNRTTHAVRLVNSDFAIVYDTAGSKVMTSSSRDFSVECLPSGIYFVKSGTKTLKIVR